MRAVHVDLATGVLNLTGGEPQPEAVAHLVADGLAGRRQPDGRDAGLRDGVRLVRHHLQPRRLAGLIPDGVTLPVERLQSASWGLVHGSECVREG